MTRTIDKQVSATYFSLRIVLAAIAVALPWILGVGGWLIEKIPLRPSISAYYHATQDVPLPPSGPCQASDTPLPTTRGTVVLPAGSMRDYFVGLLFAVGAILYSYKGYTERENVALNVAGGLIVGVALFPMPWTCGPSSAFTMHGFCAISFFLAIAYVAVFCSEATTVLLRDPKRRAKYRFCYKILGGLMIVSPILAYVFNLATAQDRFIFWAECFGIYSFAIYWVVKICEISRIGSEKHAIEKIPADDVAKKGPGPR